MKNRCDKISKERYEELNKMELGDRKLSHCGTALVYGYGVYGFNLVEKNGEYFAQYSHGDSCD